MSWKKLLLVAFLGYFLFLLVRLPAAWVAQHIASTLPQNVVELVEPKGTVWSGGAGLRSHLFGKEVFEVVWRIRPASLVLGTVSLNLQLTGVGTNLSGQVDLSFGELSVYELSGIISAAVINTGLKSAGVKVASPLGLSRLGLGFDVNESQFLSATGKMMLAKGDIQLMSNRAKYVLPDMLGQLSFDEGQIKLVSAPQSNPDQPVAEVRLKGDGQADVQVYTYLLEVTGESGPVPNPTETILEASLGVW